MSAAACRVIDGGVGIHPRQRHELDVMQIVHALMVGLRLPVGHASTINAAVPTPAGAPVLLLQKHVDKASDNYCSQRRQFEFKEP